MLLLLTYHYLGDSIQAGGDLMGDLSIFAKRLREARESRGMKQNALAEKVGVSAQTISAYEKGGQADKGKNPTLENAVAIANELGVSLDWLCGREETMQQLKGKNFTLGDIARMIVEISSWDSVVLGIVSEADDFDGNILIPNLFRSGRYPSIIFEDGRIQRFIEDFAKIRDLKDKATIDENFYLRWIEDRTSALDKISKELEKNYLPF